jgi:hypothetical protein
MTGQKYVTYWKKGGQKLVASGNLPQAGQVRLVKTKLLPPSVESIHQNYMETGWRLDALAGGPSCPEGMAQHAEISHVSLGGYRP